MRVAVVGTGLLGTSIGLAAARAGCEVRGWDLDPATLRLAGDHDGLLIAGSYEEALRDADVVVIATPVPAIPQAATAALAAAPDAVVTDVGSVKGPIVRAVEEAAGAGGTARFVPGHPMGGTERSGPEHAAAALIDGAVWVLTPGPATDAEEVGRVAAWVRSLGASPMEMDPDRHDRLVAFVSHLPQVASTVLMDLAVSEEAGEPDLLLLAAGGFRDLTRLAASDPSLWREILLSNSEAVLAAIDRYQGRLGDLRASIEADDAAAIEALFGQAKEARQRLAAKPKVRSNVAVLQVPIPDRPGALAQLTSSMAEREVNIEDLQIVHAPEGGRGSVYLTVVLGTAEAAIAVLTEHGFDPVRLA